MTFDVCSRYCFQSCDDYFLEHIYKFNACVEANLTCNCSSRISFRNPIVIVVIVAISILALILLVYCCRRRSERRRYLRLRNATAVEEPPAATFDPALEAITSTAPNESSSLLGQSHFSKGVLVEETIPIPANSPSRSNLPQEYSPPPPYHEVVNDANQPKKYGT